MNSLHSVRPVRLHIQVVRQILGLIGSESLQPGDQIPPERKLAEQLQVSRASVRQALSALEVLGTAEIRPGSGACITDDSAELAGTAVLPDVTEVSELDGPLEIVEARENWGASYRAISCRTAF